MGGMPWHTTHPSLIARLQTGSDHAAWRDFDSQYGELLVRFCMKQGLQFTDAEDVRQTVMLNLSRAMPKFQYSPERGRFRSYLGQVVRHAISNFLRHNCPGEPTFALDTVEPPRSPDYVLEDGWEREWVHHHFRRAMHLIRATQDPTSVAAFELLVAGRSIQDVAGECGLSVDAVHKVKQRMRARIKEIIQEQVRREDGESDGA